MSQENKPGKFVGHIESPEEAPRATQEEARLPVKKTDPPSPEEGAPSEEDIAFGDTLPAPKGSPTLIPSLVPVSIKEESKEPETKAPALPQVDQGYYKVDGEFARGGLGRILRATDQRLGRPVAIKELLRSRGQERFLREALLTARLQHPSIIPVHEVGRWRSGELFYSMKLVTGESLYDAIKAKKTLNERLALLPHVISACDALAYAHSQRIIHRDIKPQNILVGSFGETVVIDWGLAKDLGTERSDGSDKGQRTETETETDPEEQEELLQEAQSQREQPNTRETPAGPSQNKSGSSSQTPSTSPDLTVKGTVVGTPAFMPPEQAMGKPVDERADVYSLGAMLYYLLAGEPPYSVRGASEILMQLSTAAPRSIEERQPGVPRELSAIVEKAMSREPEGRYPTAKEMAEDLRRFQTGQIVAAHHYTRAALFWRFVRRHRAVLSVAVLALLIVGGLTSYGLYRILQASAATEREKEQKEKERALAVARADELTLRSAREALDKDPALVLALLKRLSPTFTGWGEARVLASDALARGLPKVLLGHEGSVNVVAFSPDGKLLASAGNDATIRIYRLSDASVQVLKGHQRNINVLRFSPDGLLLASGSDDGSARLWTLQSGSAPQIVAQYDEAIRDLWFSPDGKLLAVAGSNKGLGAGLLWDVSRSKVRATLKNAKDPPSSIFYLAFSPDGRLLAATCGDATVRVWDTVCEEASMSQPSSAPQDTCGAPHQMTGAAPGVLQGHYYPTWAVVFSPDSKRLATSSVEGTIRLWDVSTGDSLLLEGHRSNPYRMLFSPGGSRLISAGLDKTIRVWEVAGLLPGGTYRASRVFTGHQSAVLRLQISPDGETLFSSSFDATVRRWNLKDPENREGSILGGAEGATADISLSPDGRFLAAASVDKTVRLWDLTARSYESLPANASKIALFSPSGELLATGSNEKAHLFSVRNLTQIKDLGTFGDGMTKAIAFSPDGTLIAADSGDKGLLFSVSALTHGTATPIKEMSGVSDHGWRFVFSPDSKQLVTAADQTFVTETQDGDLRLWGLSALGSSASFAADIIRGHSYLVTGLEFLPGGRFLVSTSRDKTVRLWDLSTTPVQSRIFSGHTAGVDGLDVSPDGRFLASVGGDKTLRLWSVETGETLRRFPSESFGLTEVAFSSDGAWLAYGGRGPFVYLLELGPCLKNEKDCAPRELSGHGNIVSDLAFSPDSKTLASASWDGTARLWDVLTGASRVLTGDEPVDKLTFSPDGKILVTASEHAVRLWRDDLPKEEAGLRAWLEQATPLIWSPGQK